MSVVEGAGVVLGAVGFALTAAQKLAEKFSSVKISRSELDVAERKIKGELIEKFEEKVTSLCHS